MRTSTNGAGIGVAGVIGAELFGSRPVDSAVTRRAFLRRSAAVAAGFGGLQTLMARGAFAGLMAREGEMGYGPLVPDPAGLFDLPAGFRYTVISTVGETMDDGLTVPSDHDGMAAFPGPDGLTIVIRNHELSRAGKKSAFVNTQPSAAVRAKLYDPCHGTPLSGGTSTLVYDTKAQKLVGHHMSLIGTERNCAGGPTPRNSWITCEETVTKRDDKSYERDHGWCFEVPASATRDSDGLGLVMPQPITAMGRFNHEACATSLATGIVYQTEDRGDGLIYRYLPRNPDRLLDGGKLQVLMVEGKKSFDTRNRSGAEGNVKLGARLGVRWLDIDNVESPEDDLRFRGFDMGAARFARGEGMWTGTVQRDGKAIPTIFWACTDGGPAMAGQIWKLELPGDASELSDSAGVLELFIEPNDRGVLENADNITQAPWGDLFVCEDGNEAQYLVGVTPKGELYKFGKNAATTSELAGACFSPDGSTLFVNVQVDGKTLAITGPWRS